MGQSIGSRAVGVLPRWSFWTAYGVGEFSGVDDISELFGASASAEASAAAVQATKGQVATKGDVSLALSGTGKGWELGVAFGNLIIRKR